jgi:hypothetical protein
MAAAVVFAASSSWQVKDVPQPQLGLNPIAREDDTQAASATPTYIKRSDSCPDLSPNPRPRAGRRDRWLRRALQDLLHGGSNMPKRGRP